MRSKHESSNATEIGTGGPNELLRVTGLKVHYPVRGGLFDALSTGCMP